MTLLNFGALQATGTNAIQIETVTQALQKATKNKELKVEGNPLGIDHPLTVYQVLEYGAKTDTYDPQLRQVLERLDRTDIQSTS